MRALHTSGVVTATVKVNFGLRIIGAVGMLLGTLLCGFRLAPVSGMSSMGDSHADVPNSTLAKRNPRQGQNALCPKAVK